MRLGNEAKAKLFWNAGCKDPHAEVENEATAAGGGDITLRRAGG